jgi:N4-bis(aminopropyl)spermidine synthase
MEERSEINLRDALNAISDVIQNRPRPLRELDQIYMKAADMVLQAELVARWANGKRLAFIGDGDAISVSVAYLHKRGIIDYGPSRIVVHDFDERICGAVTRFADKERLENLESILYNVIDPIVPAPPFDCFYTNPPWGASNAGLSVKLFTRRGIEAVAYRGEGMVVIADDHDLAWPQHVLANTQRFALDCGFYVQRLMSRMHLYHLDDAPDLRSCNLMLKALPENELRGPSQAVTDAGDVANFYGREQPLRVRYVREKTRVDYGKANDDEYRLELLDKNDD